MDATQPEREPGEVTRLLHALSGGQRDGFDRVVALVYDELAMLARQRLRSERDGHTLDTGALVHEAWLRLVDQTRARYRDRQHFLAVASEAMRRVLVDHAKAYRAAKRGGGVAPLAFDVLERIPAPDDDVSRAECLVALDEALDRLAAVNPAGARIVQYHFFGGLTHEEIAELTGSSARTVRRSWMVAKAWLRREVGAGTPPTGVAIS